MPKVLSIFLIVAYSLVMFKPLAPYIEYVLNYQEISTELCENKDKPQMNCHGKCYVQKKVKKSAEEKEEPVLPNLEDSVEDLYFSETNCKTSSTKASSSVQTWPLVNSVETSGFTPGVWNPPRI